MYELLNNASEIGNYGFRGTVIISEKAYHYLSDEEIDDILQKVKTFTSKQPRDYILIFEHPIIKDRVVVEDACSLDEIETDNKNCFHLKLAVEE